MGPCCSNTTKDEQMAQHLKFSINNLIHASFKISLIAVLFYSCFPKLTFSFSFNTISIVLDLITRAWERVNGIALPGMAATVQTVRFKKEGGPSINIMTGFSKINLRFFFIPHWRGICTTSSLIHQHSWLIPVSFQSTTIMWKWSTKTKMKGSRKMKKKYL